jgi:hypothetical protein
MDTIPKILMSVSISVIAWSIMALSLHPASPLVWVFEKYKIDYDDIIEYGFIVSSCVSVVLCIVMFILL